ncbi:hypothetical protein DL770_008015 [Monosporascus sp. CRB-9-2]|nr:hypothetical protein DL770_008015 [Monosporascus sp. CRB-9-2]
MDRLKGLGRKLGGEKKSSPAELYQYQRLPTTPGTSFIRLFQLDDDDNNHNNGVPIRGRLIHVDLAATPSLSYDALSYSWGRDILTGRLQQLLSFFQPDRFPRFGVDRVSPSRPILCDGKTLHTQPNLYDFLVRMKQQQQTKNRRGRPIWIDAICIQQDDETDVVRAEKLRQLEIMGHIYAGAETVLVWLGEDKYLPPASTFLRNLEWLVSRDRGKMLDDDGEEEEYEPYMQENDILLMLEGQEKKIKREPQHPFRRSYVGGARRPDAMGVTAAVGGPAPYLSNMVNMERLADTLMNVFGRDYFRRAWVLQEVALARRLTFLIGGMQIPQDHLLGGVRLINQLERGAMSVEGLSLTVPMGPHRGHIALPHLLRAREDILAGKGGRWRFEDYLFLCRDREATRPEDKVYSLLGLVDEEMRSALLQYADHRGSASSASPAFHQLFVGCTTELAKRNGWPYILQLVSKPLIDGGGESNQPRLPSWVPDLRAPLLPKPFEYFGCKHYRAATYVKPAVFELNDSWTLTIYAAVVDEIEQVGESFDEASVVSGQPYEGHMLDLVTKLGFEYEPARRMGRFELSMDAFLRTLTGDVFKRRPLILDRLGRPSTKLRWQFTFYMDALCMSRPWFWSWFMKRARGASSQASRRIAALNSAPDLNGMHLVLKDTTTAFVAVHQSRAYPLAQAMGVKMPPTPGHSVEEEESSRIQKKRRQSFQANDRRRPIQKRLSLEGIDRRRPTHQEDGKEIRQRRRPHQLPTREPKRDSEAKRTTDKDTTTRSKRRVAGKVRPRSRSVPAYLPSMRLGRRFTHRISRFGHVSATGTANEHVDEAYEWGVYSDDTGASGARKDARWFENFLDMNQDVTTAITSIFKDRRVFRTKNRNFIGIAHDCIEKGDVVALVAGASTPFVFRPVHRGGDNKDKRFALVGSAYVHGIMYGELTETWTLLAAEFKRMVVV